METVVVTLRLPVDLFNLVRKYAKACIINEQFSNTSSITNRSVRNTTGLENQQLNLPKPTLDNVVDEVKRTGSNIDPNRFFSYYEKRNWLGKDGKPFDWKKMLLTWASYGLEKNNPAQQRNAPMKCDFSNDAPFKAEIKALIDEDAKRAVS